MKFFILLFMFLFFYCALCHAIEPGQALYTGGTSAGVKENTLGKLVTSDGDSLVFEFSGGRLTIPYERMEAYDYKEKLGRRLGIVPTIAVSMLRRRWRQHFVSVTYLDSESKPQVAVFEVPKDMPKVLIPILSVKLRKNCMKKPVPCAAPSAMHPALRPASY